jgi:hypothetical protein
VSFLWGGAYLLTKMTPDAVPPHWCLNYKRPKDRHSQCQAGYKYNKVWRGCSYEKMPCFLNEDGESKPGAKKCLGLERPSPANISAWERWKLARRPNKVLQAMLFLVPYREEYKNQDVELSVDCPFCSGGKLTILMDRGGNSLGKCSHEDCARWAE